MPKKTRKKLTMTKSKRKIAKENAVPACSIVFSAKYFGEEHLQKVEVDNTSLNLLLKQQQVIDLNYKDNDESYAREVENQDQHVIDIKQDCYISYLKSKNVCNFNAHCNKSLDLVKEDLKKKCNKTVVKEEFNETDMKEKFNETFMKKKYDETVMMKQFDGTVMNKEYNETILKLEFDETVMKEEFDKTVMKEEFNETDMKEQFNETFMKKEYDETVMMKQFDETVMNEEYTETVMKEEFNDMKEQFNESFMKKEYDKTVMKEPVAESVMIEVFDEIVMKEEFNETVLKKEFDETFVNREAFIKIDSSRELHRKIPSSDDCLDAGNGSLFQDKNCSDIEAYCTESLNKADETIAKNAVFDNRSSTKFQIVTEINTQSTDQILDHRELPSCDYCSEAGNGFLLQNKNCTVSSNNVEEDFDEIIANHIIFKNTEFQKATENNVKHDNIKCHFQDYNTCQKASLQICQCNICDYSTHKKAVLQKRIHFEHLNEVKYPCHQCDYMAFRKGSLQAHVCTFHLEVKHYKCNLCDFSSSLRIQLQQHINSAHLKIEGFKQYKCHYCDYGSFQRSELLQHIYSIHLKKKEISMLPL